MSARKVGGPLSADNPCRRSCCLNENDICLGCFRHLDEIKQWSNLDEEKRLNLIGELELRRQQHKAKWGWR